MNIQDAATGKIYSFPDDASPAQITQAMREEDNANGVKATSSGKSPSFMGKLNAAINRAGQQTGNRMFGAVNPLNPIAGAEEGLISFPIKAAKTASQAISSILPKGAQDKLSGFNNANVDQSLLQHGIGTSDNSLPTQLAQGGAAFAIPGAQEAKIASLIESASKLAPQGSSLLARLISGGESGLVNTNNPNDKLSNALGQGELNAVIPPALDKSWDGLKALGRFLKPSNVLRGPLSPEELAKNAEAAKGTKTNLTDITGSTTLQKLYRNVISKLPFSNASGPMHSTFSAIDEQGQNVLKEILGSTNPEELNQHLENIGTDTLKDTLGRPSLIDTNGQLENEGEEILKSILGTDSLADTKGQISDMGRATISQAFGGDLNPETATKDLVDNIFSTYDEEKAIKSAGYAKRNKIADEDPNFKMQAPKFANAVGTHLNKIGNTSLLKSEPAVYKIFKNLMRYKGKNEVNKNLLHNEPKLGEAHLLKAKLYNYAKAAAHSPDFSQRNEANIYRDLAHSLNEDMNDSIEASGNTELKNAHKEANAHYASNFAPFLDKSIFKYISGQADPDTVLNSLIKTGPDADRAHLIAKGTKLPGNIRESLAKAYFSRAFKNGELDPNKLSKLTSALGPNQFKELMPEANTRESFNNFVKANNLSNKMQKVLHQDGSINPQNVAKLADELKKNPAEAKEYIPDSNLRNRLNKFGDDYKKNSYFASSFNQDGTLNTPKFVKNIDNLQKNPAEFDRIVPKKEMQNKLIDFAGTYNKIKTFEPALEGLGKVNPSKLSAISENLTNFPKGSEKKVSPTQKEALQKFQRLQQINKDLPQTLANQPTGKTLLDIVGLLAGAVGGHVIGGVPGALIGSSVASGSAGALTHLLTSEKVRDSLIKAMLTQKPITKGASKSTKALAQVLANAIAQGNANA